MRKKSTYNKKPGHYFFVVKMGYQNNIMISRSAREDALHAYKNYLKQRKDCEWLGKWDGSKFIDTDLKVQAA